jgi:hypothetical protein
MGGNSVHDAENLKIICEFQGCKVDHEVRELRAEILELVLRKDARGAVAGTTADRLEISGDLDRQAVEMLRLEIQRLAARRGTDMTGFRMEPADEALASGIQRGSGETA